MITKIGRTCFAGFLGTIVVMCMATFASPTLLGGPADIAALVAHLLGGSWLISLGSYFVVGTLVLPTFYRGLIEHRLPGGPAVRGVAWGLGLWGLSQAVVVPMTGGGLFSAALGGLPVATASLVGHLAYGLVLGMLAGEPSERVFSLRHEPAPKLPERLRRAA